MKLQSFEVHGYKNLVSPITLDTPGGLGPINIIHGDNNVGKSNLLEAMELFFACLAGIESIQEKNYRFSHLMGGVDLDPLTFFNQTTPRPIHFRASVSFSPEDVVHLERQDLPTTVQVQLTLSKQAGPAPTGGINVAFPGQSSEVAALLPHLISLNRDLTRRFQHVGVHREIRSGFYNQNNQASAPTGRQLIPPALSLALYDLYNAEDPQHVARWELFVSALQDFKELFDNGTPVPIFRRAENRAFVTIQTSGGGRIAVDLLGSGLQQIIGLLGRLAVGGASILALEEPELNLRYDLQERLRRSLLRMAEDKRVGIQMFLTSHSPAFEVGDSFFAMRKGTPGPSLERRPVSEAAAFTGTSTLPTTLPHSWLSSDGVLRVPDNIQQTLGLSRGGPVAFVETDQPEVLLMSNAALGRMLDGT